jgi:hypothetical protein
MKQNTYRVDASKALRHDSCLFCSRGDFLSAATISNFRQGQVFPRLQIDRIDTRSRDLISIVATSHAQSAQPPKVAQCSSDELCKAGGAALHSLTVMTGSSVLVATHSFCGCGQCGHMLACCLHLDAWKL